MHQENALPCWEPDSGLLHAPDISLGLVCSPQGANITPALIAVAPVVHTVGKPAVVVNPVGLSVKPPPVPGSTVDGVPVKSPSTGGSGSGASTAGAGAGAAGRKMV